VLRRSLNSEDKKRIQSAAELIRDGGLVVFPTETVYGLGADALNANAVRRIYDTKGRPGDNPLILHIAGDSASEKFRALTSEVPNYAYALIEAFWPGPLTLVARKSLTLPDWVGGHPDRQADTIGIRMPAHPLALALIAAAGCPIAAPSANKAGRPSPTTLAHVVEDFPFLNGTKDEQLLHAMLALEGGNTDVGLESTVVDVTGNIPVVLRPGAITEEDIFSAITAARALPHDTLASGSRIGNFKCELHDNGGSYGTSPKLPPEDSPASIPRAPGMKYKHYAPRAEMTVLCGESENIARYILNEQTSKKIGALVFKETAQLLKNAPSNIKIFELGEDDTAAAKNLFAALRKADALGTELIFAESVHENGLGVAVMDRMKKAADGRIMQV